MREVTAALLRSVLVAALGGVGTWWVARQDSGDGYGAFLAVMAVTAGCCGLGSALDARRAGPGRAAARWAVVCLVVAVAAGVVSTVLAPGSPPGQRIGEAVAMSVFYAVPLLVGAGLGVALGVSGSPAAPRRRP